MKTDRYTKVILTVIAVCMVINVIEKIDLIPKAYAYEAEAKLPVTAPVPETPKYGLIPLNEDGSINVTMKTTAPMDVNIVGIRTYDNLDVNVNLEKGEVNINYNQEAMNIETIKETIEDQGYDVK